MVDMENLKAVPTPLGGVGLGLRAWLDFRSWLGAPVQGIVCTALSSSAALMVGTLGTSPLGCGDCRVGPASGVLCQSTVVCLAEQKKTLWVFETSGHLGSNFRVYLQRSDERPESLHFEKVPCDSDAQLVSGP